MGKALIKKLYTSKVILSFYVIAGIAVIRTVNVILLGRILSKEDMGVYSFIFASVLPLVAFLVIFGQNISVVRYFSREKHTNFAWKRYFLQSTVIFIILNTIAVIIVAIIYGFNWLFISCLWLAIFSYTMLNFIAGFLRSNKKFVSATFIEQGAPLLFVIFIGISLILHAQNINYFITLKAISYLAPFIIVFLFFYLRTKNGQSQVTKKIYTDGVMLWGIGLTLLSINRLDCFFVVKYINYESVAIYSILLAFVQIYDFASYSIYSVYSQRFSSEDSINLLSFFMKISLVGIIISIFYLVAGRTILHILFDGKYDSGIYLLLPFCMIGCLKLLYTYPSCYFIGRSDRKTLKSFLLFNILGVLVKIILIILLIKYFGLLGVAISSVLMWCYRNILGYSLVFADMKRS